ncbi:MAG: hypothetical protein LBI14_10225 [Treponema sp.]|jgi:hypothetical protein|nr:hypothetical protein [Treponema sp.]
MNNLKILSGKGAPALLCFLALLLSCGEAGGTPYHAAWTGGGGALPHRKCYRKRVMPQIENVTQIKRGL